MEENETVDHLSVFGKTNLTEFLSDLALFAGKPNDGGPESIRAVRLHTAGGRLHGWATNRYIAAHAVTGSADSGTLTSPVTVHVEDAKRIASTFKASMCVWVNVDHEARTADFTDGDATIGVRMTSGDFPNIPKAVGDPVPDEQSVVTLGEKWLDAVAKVAKRRRAPVLIATGDGRRPAHVQIGDDFRAWIMPIRSAAAGDGATAPPWLTESW